MQANKIAELIPREYRKEILQTNMISRAIASSGNACMTYLATIWKNYVSPDEDLGCSVCLERILKNFRELQPVFVDLEKQSNLLSSL